MTHSKKVLVTPEVFFSFIDRQHPKHAQSEAFFRFFAQENFHIYTATFSVIKTYNDLQEHMSYSIAKDFLRTIYLGNIEIVYPDELITKSALKLVLSNQSGDLSLEMAMINVIADNNQISQIAAFAHSSFYFGIQPFSLPY